jgi:nitrile hydratase accessory protein
LNPPEPPPRFDQPWQAQAFALTVALADAGAISWPQWTQAMAAEISRREATGEVIDSLSYHEAWVAALDGLLAAGGALGAGQVAARIEAWREAYLHTPHGRPVELARRQGG